MRVDERITTAESADATDERLRQRDAGATREPREGDARDHHEDMVADKDAVVVAEQPATLSATTIRPESSQRDQPLPGGPSGQTRTDLFDDTEAGRFRTRWTDVQGGFVDEPRRAVKEADALIADVIKRLADVFANERTRLERQWDRGDNVTTEDLRVALQRYRAFFDRLISA